MFRQHAILAALIAPLVGACGGALSDDPILRSCPEISGVAEAFPLHGTVEVCGHGRLWTQDDQVRLPVMEATLRWEASSGLVVDEDDRPVLGVSTEASDLDPVFIPEHSPSVATTAAEVWMNLHSTDTFIRPFDPLSPSATSDYQTSFTVYGPMGEPCDIQLYMVKLGDTAWRAIPMYDRSTAGALEVLGECSLVFTADGALAPSSPCTVESPLHSQEAEPWELSFSPETTTRRSASQVYGVQQDGRERGELQGLDLTPRGEIQARYSNGVTDSWWILDGVEGWLLSLD